MLVFLTITAAVLSATAVPASLPAAVPIPASASESTFTPQVMNKMLQLVAARGGDTDFAAPFANALGLTADGQAWPDRQIAANATDKLKHVFAISRGTDPDIVLYYRDANSAHVFRSTRDGKALGAMNYDLQSKVITIRPVGEVQKELDAQLSFWARSVDKLLAGE